MSVYPDKAKGRWRFSFNRIISGQRTRATKLLPAGWSRARAEAYDRSETARLYAVASGLERPEPSIGEAVALYLDHRIPKLRNGKKAARELAQLIDYIDDKPMSQLAAIALEYAKDHLELAPATVRNRLSYLKAACRYAWKKHALTENDPTGRMELPVVNNERLVDLPVQDLQDLLKGIEDIEARALFTLAFYTGSRWASEILPRQPEDIVREGRDVSLRVGTTKNGTPRLVPVHPSARWALKFLPFTPGQRRYYNRFVAARVAVGLCGLWIHDMRHVLGTDIVRRTGNQRDAMEALHHASIQSSLRYTRSYGERLRDVLYAVGDTKRVHTVDSRRRRRRVA